ncbi:MAG: ATP-dependent Clp protease proteolytic subunit [Richelia sp. RM2_1_2]|nr:ATP-dependent Clp protease proteolytic subunit [Richelia sp. RM2_1_2]
MNNGQEFKKFATKHMGIPSSNLHRFESRMEQAIYAGDPSNMTRSIIEERQTNFREIDVFSRLMADRIIFLGMGIDDHISNIVCAQMLFLANVSSQDITMYINSPGGSVYAGYGIRDTMQLIRPDVSTICVSLAASMGAILLTSGTPGKRLTLPYSRIMIHQPLGGMQGQASDMEISYKQMQIIKKELYEIIQMHLPVGKERTLEQIEKDCDRDNWMKGQEAIDYGIVDEIVSKAI